MICVDLLQVASNFGFPAIMCVMLFKKMEKQETRYMSNENKLRNVINDNTQAIIELKSMLTKEVK